MYNGNPFFSEEKAEYLILNGFEESRSETTTTVHFKDPNKGLLISINNNHVDVFDCRTKLNLLHGFSGIEALGIVSFMMLLHITGAITLNEFAANVRSANANPIADIFINAKGNILAVPIATSY